MINEKTKGQGETQLWSKQRVGRITASNFYKICHLREATNKDNTLKELLITVHCHQTATWLEGDNDYTMKHTQLLPGQLTLKMLMGYFLGIL